MGRKHLLCQGGVWEYWRGTVNKDLTAIQLYRETESSSKGANFWLAALEEMCTGREEDCTQIFFDCPFLQVIYAS